MQFTCSKVSGFFYFVGAIKELISAILKSNQLRVSCSSERGNGRSVPRYFPRQGSGVEFTECTNFHRCTTGSRLFTVERSLFHFPKEKKILLQVLNFFLPLFVVDAKYIRPNAGPAADRPVRLRAPARCRPVAGAGRRIFAAASVHLPRSWASGLCFTRTFTWSSIGK